MTLRELRDILNHLPEDISLELPVLVKGYEGGYKDIELSHVGVRQVCFDYRKVVYMGPHELAVDTYFCDDEERASKTIGPALIIDRSPLG